MERATQSPERSHDEFVVSRSAGGCAQLRAHWKELEFLRPSEIAHKLGYATAEPVYDAIRRGELHPHVRQDGAYLIHVQEALRYIGSLRVTEPPTAEPRQRPAAHAGSRSPRREGLQLTPKRIKR